MTENMESNGCPQRDSAEHKGYAEASRSFNRIWKERDSTQPKLLEAILDKDNLNRAYKRVKANKGAAGIDGMTVEEALPYLKEQGKELARRISRGKYPPSPVRRVKILVLVYKCGQEKSNNLYYQMKEQSNLVKCQEKLLKDFEKKG